MLTREQNPSTLPEMNIANQLTLPVPQDGANQLLSKIARNSAASIGQYGLVVASDTNAKTGLFVCIHAVTDSVIASATAETGFSMTGSLNGVTLKAGDRIFGRFSAFTLTSGTAIGYLAPRS